MILSNYWRFIKELNTHDAYDESKYGSETVTSSMINMNGESGVLIYVTASRNQTTMVPPMNNNRNIFNNGISILFGSGTGEIQPTDYDMDNDVTSSLSNINVSISETVDDSGIHRIITATGLNQTSSPITITQVGITKDIFSGYQTSVKCLLAKTALNKPIEVKQNQEFSVTLEWVEA